MRGTKEFYEVMDSFEKSMKNSSIYCTDLTRVEKGSNLPKSQFYDNGKTNELFTVYMMGYSSGKLTERLG